MIWYGAGAACRVRTARLGLAKNSELPAVRRYVARRAVSAEPGAGLAAVVAMVKTTADAACVDILTGTRDALRGRKHVAKPEGWTEAFLELAGRRDLRVIEQTLLLGLDVDEPKAVGVLRRVVLDPETSVDERSRMLTALVERHVPKLATDLQTLTGDKALRGLALRSLAAYDDRATPEIILRHIGEYSPEERNDAIATLAARPAWAMALLEALGRGHIQRRDVSVSIARQLQAFGDQKLSEQLEKVWGKVQPTSKAKAGLMAKHEVVVSLAAILQHLGHGGRAVFNQTTCVARQLPL